MSSSLMLTLNNVSSKWSSVCVCVCVCKSVSYCPSAVRKHVPRVVNIWAAVPAQQWRTSGVWWMPWSSDGYEQLKGSWFNRVKHSQGFLGAAFSGPSDLLENGWESESETLCQASQLHRDSDPVNYRWHVPCNCTHQLICLGERKKVTNYIYYSTQPPDVAE